jgi:ABC-type transporter Mla subunit MlaD
MIDMENPKQTTEELTAALNEATKDELVNLTLALQNLLNLVNQSLANNQKLLADQQKTINNCRELIKTLVHLHKGKVTVDLDSFSQATAPGMDLEEKTDEKDCTITLTLTKRSLQ